MKFFVGVTGASGSLYSIKLIKELAKLDNSEIHLSVTPDGFVNIGLETGENISNYDELLSLLNIPSKVIHTHHYKNFSAPPSSGSYKIDKYIVCPASMGFIGRAASGISSNLIERAVDVAMKEYREVVLLFRETPLNQIHLNNLLTLSRCGVKIVPAAPAFYNKPNSIDDLISFVVGKIFDIMGIEHSLFTRWGNGENI